MTAAPGAAWLTLWALFALLGLLGRRDRRLVYRLPVVGVAVLLAGAVAGRTAGGWWHVAVLIAGGCALPFLFCWIRAYVWQDARGCGGGVRAQHAGVFVCLCLGVIAAVVYAGLGCALVDRWQYSDELTLFESDAPVYARFMSGAAAGEHPVTHKHPVYVLVARALYLLAEPLSNARYAPVMVNALAGGLAVALAAAYFRRVTGSRALSVLLAVALGATAAHVVFGAVPETYALSAAGLILVHLLLARRSRGGVRLRHEAPAGVLAIGATTTHVFTAFICYLFGGRGHRRRRSLLRWGTSVAGLLCIPLALQTALLPETALQTEATSLNAELRYVQPQGARPMLQAVGNVARGVLAENVVAAQVVLRPDTDGHMGLHLGAYDSRFARICLAVWWLVLAVSGVAILARRRTRRPTLWAALLCLGAAVGLHTFYGNAHVFLFSCTFTFYLFAVVAHALPVLPRFVGFVLVGVLAALLVVNDALFCAQWFQMLAEGGPPG